MLITSGLQPCSAVRHLRLTESAMLVQAGQMYLFRFVDAMLMRILDLNFNTTGCTMGLLSRDGIPLPVAPRMTDHIMMAPANR